MFHDDGSKYDTNSATAHIAVIIPVSMVSFTSFDNKEFVRLKFVFE